MDHNKYPLVSIITNSYNLKPFLRRNIESLLCQTYQNWEHIIVDCGSSDGSFEEACSFQHNRLKVFKIPFCGISEGRNYGIQKSSGKIIAILDSDDQAAPDRLMLQVNALLGDRELVGIGSGMLRVDEGSISKSKKFIYPGNPREINFLLRSGCNPIPHSTFSFWKAAFYAAGGYSELIEKGEDYELLLRMLNIGNLTSLSEVLVTYSRRPSSHTNRHQSELMPLYIYLSLLINSTSIHLDSVKLEKIKNNLLRMSNGQIKAYLTGLAIRNFIRDFYFLDIKTSMMLFKMIFNKLPSVIFHPCIFLEALTKSINLTVLKFIN